MNIRVDGEIGSEVHPDTDQFLKIEQGNGLVLVPDLQYLHWQKPGIF